MVMLMLTSVSDAEAQCARRAMACNNLLHLSLDDSCKVEVTVDMILEDMVGVEADYELRIFDPQGNRINTNILRDDYDCKKLKVEVQCRQSDIYCWGYIIVEDKIKPNLTITPLDTAVTCNVYDFDLQPNSLVTRVSFSDQGSCEKPDSLGIVDLKMFPNDACNDTVMTIQRFWRVVDKSKYQNDSTVIQTIHLLRPTFDEFDYPRDTIISCEEVGDLSTQKLGEPELRSCKDYFDMTMQEIEFDGICGAARKISRSWKIFDTCRNRDTTVYQTIEIIDTTAPVLDFSVFTVPVDRFEVGKEDCTASARDIPNPIITDCSVIQPEQLRAFYQFVDDMNVPFGFRYDAQVNDLETFDLIDVPIGQPFVVIFEATDSCGNISLGQRGPFTAEDTADPNAVCEKTTIVSINNTGLTEVTAAALDDYSYDNCGIVRKEIRRMDSNCAGFNSDRVLGNSVHFCCEDVANNPIRVLLRVYDAYDNHSDCIIDVIVQDKRVPTITCKSDISLDCSFDLSGLEARVRQAANIPDVTWVCGVGTIEPTIPDVELSTCGYAAFTVTWTATDANGASSTCQQRVVIDNLNPVTITPPPAEITLNDCNGGVDPDIIGGKPVVNNVDCEQIVVSHQDTPFEIVDDPTDPDLCRKISRTWSVLDWCKFDGGNTNSALIASYTQVIKIRDLGDPVFATSLDDFEVIDTDKDCKQTVSVTVNATDNCTDVDDLKYTYGIDIDGDDVDDITGATNSFNNELPVGEYRITFTVEDECGNLAQTTANFEVVPTKAPTVLLQGAYPANIQANGSVTIIASDMNNKSTQGCSNVDDNLTFAFSNDPTNVTRTFTCSDISNGVRAEVPTEVFVIDEWGNYNSATVNIILSDLNNDVCQDDTSSVSMSGTVMSEDQAGVANISVSAFNMITNQSVTAKTDAQGRYQLAGLKSFDDYQVRADLSGYDDTGISTLDILLIQRHILGLTPLETPYKMIAADVNGSRSISASDLVSLRRLLLGKVDALDESWRFISSDFTFDDEHDPWAYPHQAEIYDLSRDINSLDFIGIKTGDVSGNAFGALAGLGGVRSTATLSYSTEQNGDLITYTLTPKGVEEIAGLQMALAYDSDMTLVDVQGLSITIDEGMMDITDGEVRLSWSSGAQTAAGDEAIVALTFRASRPGALFLQEAIDAEVYDAALQTHQLALSAADATVAVDGLALLANTPNPFSGETMIRFDLAEAGMARLTIADASGRAVYTHRDTYPRGANRVIVSSDDLPAEGIYYYTITTDRHTATRRMVVLR